MLCLLFCLLAIPMATGGSLAAAAEEPAPAKLEYGFGQWPPDLSTHGKEIGDLYDLIFWVTGLTFVVTEGLLILFIYVYRDRPGRKATYFHGHTGLEIAWTLIPVVIFVTLGLQSAGLWSRLKDRRTFPQDAFLVKVVGKQFEWKVYYPGEDGEFGTDDDPFESINEMHVPYGKPVRVQLTAEDVLHSFFLPELRVKQDAVPGMMSEVWFEATQPAETEIACAELCGLGHYRMRGTLKIESAEKVAEWIEEELE